MATLLDGILFWVILFLVAVPLAGLFGSAGGIGGFVFGGFIAWLGYIIALLWFLSKGLTPGKLLMGEQVVEHLRGGYPGLGRMLVREVFGKFVSGLFMGLGYFWAIWDKDGQAWHDKIAGTVIVRTSGTLAVSNPSGMGATATTRSKFCTACGVRINTEQRFCSACGAASR